MGAVMAAKNSCTTIQDGDLNYPAGHYLKDEPLQVGYDIFGYNYQAHMFNGLVANVYLGRDGFEPWDSSYDVDEYLTNNPGADTKWYWPYLNTELLMKWNDAWLSNKDCDGDGLLDRHYGYDIYNGSGAWLTNHEFGTYVNDTGETCSYTYFCKIVAAPADAYVAAPYDEYGQGTWYTADETEIGPQIWGAFAIIEEVENDPCAGLHGLQYRSPASPGVGYYMP
jgi:hypothetical protein